MICAKCETENAPNNKFCINCGAPLESGRREPPRKAPPKAAGPGTTSHMASQQPGEKVYVTGKNPTLAALLSVLIAGLGQFYNGDTKKGAVILLAAIFLGTLSAGLIWLGLAVYGAYDAYQVASGKTPLWK